ncbi:hypothetical protein CFBP6625_06280 [Agrobacterium tumefaciens]|nr:hypothetical protein CFBP6625_06280 [Agrobacterium tumefaciens]
MTKEFDWDEFLQTVTGETSEFYKPLLSDYIRHDLETNDIVAPDSGCCFATSLELIGLEEGIWLSEVTGNRVVALYTLCDVHPGSVSEPITSALAIFPDDDVSIATLALKGCPFVDLTS